MYNNTNSNNMQQRHYTYYVKMRSQKHHEINTHSKQFGECTVRLKVAQPHSY